jgi:hypothetical protein
VLRNHPHFAGTLRDPTHERLMSVYFDPMIDFYAVAG